MRLSLSNRLNLVLGSAVVIAAVLSAFLVSTLGSVDQRYRAALDGPVRDQALAREMQVVFKKQVQEWKNILLRGASARDRSRYIEAFNFDHDEVVAFADSLDRRVTDTVARRAIADFRREYAALDTAYAAALVRFEAADGRNPFAVDSLVRGKDRAPTDLIDGIVARLETEVAGVVAQERARVTERCRLAMLGVVVLLVVLIVIPPLLNRAIVLPITRLQMATARVASGDLSEDVRHSSADEIGDLARSFQTMTVSLRELLADIKRGATRLSATATDLAHSADEVNHSMLDVAQAASSIAEAASHQSDTVTQSLDATRVVADRSESISAESTQAGRAAEVVTARTSDGRTASASAEARLADVLSAAESTAPALASLGEKTRGIQAFTDVVAGIATQSKLLAINAAIEAARAGEHGRGFGVVAEEVAKLARESQDALTRIRELALEIDATSADTGSRVGQVRQAVKDGAIAFAQLETTLTAIDEEAKRSSAAVMRIGLATTEQSARSAALAASMESMAAVTEENAATAEQLSASNEEQAAALQRIAAVTGSLREVALELSSRLDRFRLPEEGLAG